MEFNLGLIVVVALLVSLKVFWELYQAYSKQRLRRRLKDIHRNS